MMRGVFFKLISIVVIITSAVVVSATNSEKTIYVTGSRRPVTISKCLALLASHGQWISLRSLRSEKIQSLNGRYVAVTRVISNSLWHDVKNVGETELVVGTVVTSRKGLLPNLFRNFTIYTDDGLREVTLRDVKKIRVLHDVSDPSLMSDITLNSFFVKELKAILEPTLPLVKSPVVEVRVRNRALEIEVGDQVFRDGQGDVTIDGAGDGAYVDYLIKPNAKAENALRLVIRGGLASLYVTVEGRDHSQEILAAHLISSLISE